MSCKRALAALCACGCMVSAAACRSVAPPAGPDVDLRREIKARGFEPGEITIPWQLSSAMREWVHREVPDNLATDLRLERLLSALLGSDGLALEYQAGTTGTAQEVFASHRANCLGFTSIFVGMARELGVQVFYLDVGDVEKFERDGNLVVESGHITAGYGSGSLVRILEFTPVATPSYRQLRPVSDRTAVALYYSNRGAELMRAGNDREAVVWLQKAVLLDPELARAQINYGVSLRRTGDPAGAEAAYRKALDDDPSAVAAYQNLAAVLYSVGRRGEADQLMTLSSKLDNRNPYNFLALGDVAMSHGRTDEARGYYHRAQHLGGADAEAAAALGQLALASGDRGEAKRWLRRAAARDSGNERVQRLAAQLGEKLPRKPPPPAASAAARPAAGPAAQAPRQASVPGGPPVTSPPSSSLAPGAQPAAPEIPPPRSTA